MLLEAQVNGVPPWWFFLAIVAGVVAVGLLVLVFAVERTKKKPQQVCGACKRVVMPDWQKCLFCGAMLGAERAELEFIAGSMAGKTLDLDRDVTTLGTAAGNTILLNDTGVSRKHVGIRRVEASYEIADLGSTNGVYVNGERVKKPQMLRSGDVIRVGATEMVFKT